MTNILVRDVPDEVHAALQRRAEQRHQSLQQFLVRELGELAERRSISEVLDAIDKHEGGRVGLEQSVRDLRELRREQ